MRPHQVFLQLLGHIYLPVGGKVPYGLQEVGKAGALLLLVLAHACLLSGAARGYWGDDSQQQATQPAQTPARAPAASEAFALSVPVLSDGPGLIACQSS